MISLGTAALFDDSSAHCVSIAITWEREHAWSGILGGSLDWQDLLGRPLELDIPGSLAPGERPVMTDVIIDAVLENGNEARARGTIRGPAELSTRLRSLSRA